MTLSRTYTRKLNKVLNDLDDKFKSICDASAFERKLTQLRNAPQSARPTVLNELYGMLDRCSIVYERKRETEYYEQLISMSEIPDAEEIEILFVAELCSKYHEYPTPEQYMLRIVNTLSSSADVWDNDTLRVRILKQFIKYGSYLAEANFGGRMTVKKYVSEKLNRAVNDNDVLANLDDGIFSCLEDAIRDDLKPKGRYGIIKLADDLASGKFRTGGATRRGLYLFAMVYGMTYTIDSPDRITDFKSDIEKNLFTDYYTNNLMRYISDVYKNGLSQFEADPSGQGINYKNFAEMIYLYFINNSKYTPQEKISMSARMIANVQDSASKKISSDKTQAHGTMYYRELFTEDILMLSEDKFEEFIRKNYNCNTGGTIGGIQLETSQNTAFTEYQAILSKLKAHIRERDELPNDDAVSFESCNYGLWFTGVLFNDIDTLKEKVRVMRGVDEKKFNDFLVVINAVNNFLVPESVLQITNPSLITRTSILAAWYYYFNAIHETDAKGIWDSFETLYNAFKSGIDPILQKSGYQLLNGKNIFDILLTFSSYAFMNL